jgi:hypothetical protein
MNINQDKDFSSVDLLDATGLLLYRQKSVLRSLEAIVLFL